MGIAGRFAGDRAQAEALGRVEAGALDPAVVERQAFGLAIFEKQLAVVHAGQRLGDDRLDPAGSMPVRSKNSSSVTARSVIRYSLLTMPQYGRRQTANGSRDRRLGEAGGSGAGRSAKACGGLTQWVGPVVARGGDGVGFAAASLCRGGSRDRVAASVERREAGRRRSDRPLRELAAGGRSIGRMGRIRGGKADGAVDEVADEESRWRGRWLVLALGGGRHRGARGGCLGRSSRSPGKWACSRRPPRSRTG